MFRSTVRPFVYRRYLDFGVFEALRGMKALIEREVSRRDLQDNVKLGPGGIREIEFIVQSLQLIRGGTERRLQNASLLHTLPLLGGARLLAPTVTGELAAAYEFLRRLENRLQMYQDQQTHALPTEAVARERIALAMGCSRAGTNWPLRSSRTVPEWRPTLRPWCRPDGAASPQASAAGIPGSKARSRARCSRRGCGRWAWRRSRSPRSCCRICAVRPGRGAWTRRGAGVCTR